MRAAEPDLSLNGVSRKKGSIGGSGKFGGREQRQQVEEHEGGGTPALTTCLAHTGHSTDTPFRTTFQGMTGLPAWLSGVTGVWGDHWQSTGRSHCIGQSDPGT